MKDTLLINIPINRAQRFGRYVVGLVEHNQGYLSLRKKIPQPAA